jgi:hypothetical protein
MNSRRLAALDSPHPTWQRGFSKRCRVQAVVAAACWIAVSVSSGHADAQNPAVWSGAMTAQANGTMVQMPINRPVSRRSKLTLTLDTRWANNYGYRPVEVTVSSPTPVTADRLITIRLHSKWWSRESGTVAVEQDFELPLGSTSATTTIACPQYQLATQMFWWEVWVDGVKDKDLSITEKIARTTMLGGISAGAGTGVSCLIVGPANSRRTLSTTGTLEFEFLSLPAADFPQRWIDYTCLDVVALSQNELILLSKVNPQALEATRRWVQAGGRLWVSDIGSELEQLEQISKLLGLEPTLIETQGDVNEEDPGARPEAAEVGWRSIRFMRGNPEGQAVTFLNLNTGSSRVERDPQEIDRLRSDPNFVTTAQEFEPIEERRQRRWPRDSSRWFVEQRCGLGAVRAFREKKESILAGPLSSTTITSLGAITEVFGANGEILNSIATPNSEEGSDRIATPLTMALRSTPNWETRHGMTPDAANPDFAKLLVPGVGMAPVSEFQVLITLFVLLIGPANFWLLKRTRRLHLLVLTVPLAAILTTAALFAYAIISDGFGTTVRAHSFATLDQRTGEVACWARLSYYSGFAPGEGLTTPDDVAMYPVIPGWNESGVDTSIGVARELLWEGNEAKLKRGWLRSRTPTQYLAVRSGKSQHKLELLTAADNMRATNRLGADIEFVLAIDGEGKLFAGEDLADGARANLPPIARNEAIRRLRDLVVKNAPQAPEALASGDSEFAIMQQRQQRQVYRRYGLQYSTERLGTNLAHGAISELAGLEGAPALQLPPRSYVAVTKTGAEMTIGMSGAKELASFHVILGQW